MGFHQTSLRELTWLSKTEVHCRNVGALPNKDNAKLLTDDLYLAMKSSWVVKLKLQVNMDAFRVNLLQDRMIVLHPTL